MGEARTASRPAVPQRSRRVRPIGSRPAAGRAVGGVERGEPNPTLLGESDDVRIGIL
jgi:hypothetical protein